MCCPFIMVALINIQYGEILHEYGKHWDCEMLIDQFNTCIVILQILKKIVMTVSMSVFNTLKRKLLICKGFHTDVYAEKCVSKNFLFPTALLV